MASHTPGPWHFDTEKRGNGLDPKYIVGAEHGVRITQLALYDDDIVTGVQRANARLIAASPDLLEVVNKMVYLHEFYDRKSSIFREDYARCIKAARAAIAKAEGSAPDGRRA